VAFTICVDHSQPLFIKEEVVRAFIPILREVIEKHACIVPIYCFMPDHLHVILHGKIQSADTCQAMVEFKQRSGYWLKRNRPTVRWQKDFYDHIVRKSEDLGAQVRYIAMNPVRKELVEVWEKYAFTGALGVDLEKVMADASVM